MITLKQYLPESFLAELAEAPTDSESPVHGQNKRIEFEPIDHDEDDKDEDEKEKEELDRMRKSISIMRGFDGPVSNNSRR